MALIICPECGKQISNLAKQCIHCGCPIQKENVCFVDGVEFDLTNIKHKILSASNYTDSDTRRKLARELGTKIDTISIRGSFALIDIIRQTGEVPKTFDTTPYRREQSSPSTVRCPKCSSTQITTGQRGYSMVWGFMGSSKTINRCANCGHKWEPRR